MKEEKVGTVRIDVDRPTPLDNAAIKQKIESGKVTTKGELRGFTIHGREYWMTRAECYEEFGAEDGETIWKSGKRQGKRQNKNSKTNSKKVKREAKTGAKPEPKPEAKPEPKKEKKPKEPSMTAPGEDAILKAVASMKGEVTSTSLRDYFALDKEHGRGIIRHAMDKLAKEGKIKITEKAVGGKRKQYVYEVVK